MQETFYPNFIKQEQINRPIDTLPPLELPTASCINFIVDDEINGSVNDTSSVAGNDLCEIPRDPTILRIKAIFDHIDFSKVQNLTALLGLVRIAFN